MIVVELVKLMDLWGGRRGSQVLVPDATVLVQGLS